MTVNNLERFRDVLFDMLVRQGVGDDVLYVYKKTGILIMESTLNNLSKEEFETARKAMAEYQNLAKQTCATVH